MRIIELVESQSQIDEVTAAGVGQGIGKAAGSVVQGAGNFFKGIKQGYKSARTPATPEVPASGTAPATGAAAPAVDVDQIKSQIAQKQKEIKSLQSQITATEPGIGQATNTVGATATNTPAAQSPAQGVAPAAQEPAVEPGIGQQQNTVGATATNTEQPAVKRNPNNPDDLGFGFDVDTGLPLKSQAEKDANIAKADAAEKAAATAQQPAAPAGAPAATAPKMTAKDQNALKARLKAKQGTAAKTQTGFNQYVQGGGGSTLAGADAQGNPVFKQNVKRESVEFYSKFLGQML